MMPLVVWVSAASAACGDEGALARALADADAALAVLDGQAFGAAVDRARTEVGCAHELLPPTLAAALHRAVVISGPPPGRSPPPAGSSPTAPCRHRCSRTSRR